MTIVRPKIIKPPKIPSRKSLVRDADSLWRAIIKRDGICEMCGREDGSMNAHHVFGRGRLVLRWDLLNGVCLCFRCHKCGAHSPNVLHVEKYLKWVKKYKADDWQYLSDKLKGPVPTITNVKLMDIIKELKEAE